MDKIKEHYRIETKASHTALMGAIHRFIATKDKRLRDLGQDNLAHIFMPPKAKFFLQFSFFRNLFLKKLHEKVPGSYEYLTSRTKFFDGIFVEAAKEKTPQIVFLGAGYDTRAIRFQHLTKDSIIFELDAYTTQNEKKKHLTKNKVNLPGNIVLVPINFNKDDIRKVILSHGYNPERKTLFIWEGVTMYIKPESVKGTLLFIKNNSGIDSTLTFDYFYNSVIKRTNTSFGAKKLSESASKLGEKFNFGIEEGRVDEFLKENGFLLKKHYAPKEFEERYLKMNNGNIIGNMYGFAGHIIAKLRND